jgi:hypothetical protein
MSAAVPLLVPVEVQAMVLNNTAVNFIRQQMNYDNLAECQSPAPSAFGQDVPNFAGDTRNHGVYLRWILPRALRHAEHMPDGRLDFPFAPNRWLVVRLYRPRPLGAAAPAAAPQLTAWVVDSDALGSIGGANYVDPTQATLTQVQMGRMVAITVASPWQETASSSPYFLSAVAEGNAEFAAYQPFHQNVFSIHDPLFAEGIEAGTLSYFVQGWYSNAKADVLADWLAGPKGTGFVDELTELRWKASALVGGAHTSVYHGSAAGVDWRPLSTAPPSPKDNAHPLVAVGNTSVDAVAAFARAAFSAPNITPPPGVTAQQAADLLEAFLYNMIPVLGQADGERQLEQRIRDQWFGSAGGGTSWTIVDAAIAPGAPEPESLSAAELAKENTWLAALNIAQDALDDGMRALMALQRRLFELWWKQQAAAAAERTLAGYPWNTTPAQFVAALDPSAPDGLIDRARTLVLQLAEYTQQVPMATAATTLQDAIAAFGLAKGLPPTRVLKAAAKPRFWSAADPVMVISGTAHTMKIDPDAALSCRWPAELITGLTVTPVQGVTSFPITSVQLASYLPALCVTNLPAITDALYAEFFLLDPTNAPLVAAAAGKALSPAEIDTLATSMAVPVPMAGTVPGVLAAYPWQQPWQPIYLDWEVRWYPIPFLNDGGAPNWTFNGTDYDVLAAIAQPVPVVLDGRCVLTPKPTFEFKSRIDQYTRDYPGEAATHLAAVEALVQAVDQWDFLSQAFSGLGVQLASWNPVPTNVPPNNALAGGTQGLADLVGAQAQCPPRPLLGEVRRTIPSSSFEAMRGGQLAFTRLTVVDVFGQTLEIITGQNAPQTGILTADGLQVSQPIVHQDVAGLVQLPPRLLQPARLNFEFMPATESTNPILGWVLPNHVDGGLAVYGAEGTHYGELSPAVDVSGKSYVHWWPAPDTPFPDLSKLPTAQPQFGGFLWTLHGAGVDALGDFVRSVDETLWTVDPLGDRSDAYLSVLLGRPLAVVHAAVSFELQAAAWTDPAWPYTFMTPHPTPRFLDYRFPVQFGDVAARQDGLLGYFLDGDYRTFNAVHIAQPGPTDPPLSDYLRQIGPGNWVEMGFAANGPGPARTLLLVMDPRAAVHAQCGILPRKDISLIPAWVDGSLKAMNATFRTGPLLAEVRAVTPQGSSTPVDTLLTLAPAERQGTWTWRQPLPEGRWAPGLGLAPADGSAVFPDAPPILRDGLLQLTGGLGE